MQDDVVEPRLVVRPLSATDFDAVVELQLACFPRMEPWRRDQFESQVRLFPEGQIGIEIDGRLAASSASLIVDEADVADWHDWAAVSSGGTIARHDADGDSLYGIEIQVHPEFRGMKLARRLYDARKELCRRHNLARIVIGGRIPGYEARKGEMTAQAYVEAVQRKELYDPVLTTQVSNGFVLRGLIQDYLPSDEDSGGWATWMEWANLDYVAPRSRRQRRAVQGVRVGTVQYPMNYIESWDEFARQVRFFVDTASDYKCDFLLFPELFTLQLLCLLEPGRPGEAARELAGFADAYHALFRDLAVNYDVNIIGGSTFVVDDDGKLRNAAYLFRRDGTVARQDKIHVTPNEARWWGVTGGTEVQTFDTDRGRVAIAVCYDVEFPELARVHAASRAQLLFVPYNTSDRQGHLRVSICARARAIENHLYVVTAGCVGNLPDVENADLHYAQSGIYTPSDVQFARDGVAGEASTNLEAMLVHDVDLEVTRRHKREGTVRPWADRRCDLYRVVWKGREI